eukprot:NODE_173_length_14219_cov_0.603824.p12 type:complete len:115 gc:universal NODE_173_length_14219_cov_0.603824:12496-12152(-)
MYWISIVCSIPSAYQSKTPTKTVPVKLPVKLPVIAKPTAYPTPVKPVVLPRPGYGVNGTYGKNHTTTAPASGKFKIPKKVDVKYKIKHYEGEKHGWKNTYPTYQKIAVPTKRVY